MKRHRIVAIVEGHGEEVSVPLLLRRWFKHRRFSNFETPDRAIRACGAGAIKCAYHAQGELGIEYFVELAAKARPDGILVLLDADDECLERTRPPKREGLGPELTRRARAALPWVPIEVVVANREYEAWLLAAVPDLERGEEARPNPADSDVESFRDCKKRLSIMLGRRYEPSVDQLEMTGALPFSQRIARRSPSFARLLRALDSLAKAARSRSAHPGVKGT